MQSDGSMYLDIEDNLHKNVDLNEQDEQNKVNAVKVSEFKNSKNYLNLTKTQFNLKRQNTSISENIEKENKNVHYNRPRVSLKPKK